MINEITNISETEKGIEDVILPVKEALGKTI